VGVDDLEASNSLRLSVMTETYKLSAGYQVARERENLVSVFLERGVSMPSSLVRPNPREMQLPGG